MVGDCPIHLRNGAQRASDSVEVTLQDLTGERAQEWGSWGSSKWEVLGIWEQGGDSCIWFEDLGRTELLGGEARARPRPGLQKGA